MRGAFPAEANLIPAHGGVLIDRMSSADAQTARAGRATTFPSIPVSERAAADLDLIATGAYSPLSGFLDAPAYRRVVEEMRLPDGTLWPVPVVLDVDERTKNALRPGERATLVLKGEPVGEIDVSDVFQPDPPSECRFVFGTEDVRHPGVAAVMARNAFLVGGAIRLYRRRFLPGFEAATLSPRDTRNAFRKRGWAAVAGFQTRNPMHRGHEYLTKCALETVDGLLIHPVVGALKADDLPADVRMRCYQALIDRYYRKERVVLAATPANMLYAGPREAILHAIIRQNHGCTHFIVGRDHAGVGRFYEPDAAQRALRSLSRADLRIEPMCFEQSFWCRRTNGMATEKTSPAAPHERIALSGSEVRAYLARREAPPAEVVRPEVARILIESIS